LQILVLIFTKSFIFYLLLQIPFTILGNLSLSQLVHRKFRSIFLAPEKKIEKSTIARMKKNVLGNIANSIGEKVVLGTDTLLISGFIGLDAAASFSVYQMFPQAVLFVLWSFVSSLTATIGNVSVTENETLATDVFRKCAFLNYLVVLLFTLGIYFCATPFVRLFFSANYLLPRSVVCMVAVNFFIMGIRHSQNLFINAYGLAWNQRYKPIIEAILNLAFSISFLKIFNLGVRGVLLGTICSSICTVSWIEPYIVFKYALKKPFRQYGLLALKQVILFGISAKLCSFMAGKFHFSGILELLFNAGIVVLVTILVIGIGYRTSKELIYVKDLSKNLLAKWRLKKNGN